MPSRSARFRRIIATSGLGFFQALAVARRHTQASHDMSKVGPLLWPMPGLRSRASTLACRTPRRSKRSPITVFYPQFWGRACKRSAKVDDFQVDVLVVGAGNAAACAALAAREMGASVAMLEAAPEEERGGNSTYTAGAMRVVFHGVDDLVQLYDLTEDEKRDVDFGSYSADQFLDDMGRVTNYRCDPELTDILINRSFETAKWMRSKGVRFQPSYGRQAFKVNGKYKFWGGLAVEAWCGGPGLVDLEHKAAAKAGIPIHYETPAVSLIEEDGVVRGVIARHKGRKIRIGAKAVVLACGGF